MIRPPQAVHRRNRPDNPGRKSAAAASPPAAATSAAEGDGRQMPAGSMRVHPAPARASGPRPPAPNRWPRRAPAGMAPRGSVHSAEGRPAPPSRRSARWNNASDSRTGKPAESRRSAPEWVSELVPARPEQTRRNESYEPAGHDDFILPILHLSYPRHEQRPSSKSAIPSGCYWPATCRDKGFFAHWPMTVSVAGPMRHRYRHSR